MEPMYFFKFHLFLRFDAEAYFICEDEKAIVNDGRGLNTIGIFCRPDDNVPDFPTDYEWPQCVREPECIDLPTPSEESRLQKSPKIGDSVKIGENKSCFIIACTSMAQASTTTNMLKNLCHWIPWSRKTWALNLPGSLKRKKLSSTC